MRNVTPIIFCESAGVSPREPIHGGKIGSGRNHK
jgi:hypothetical protein